jgi:hypothetical protein
MDVLATVVVATVCCKSNAGLSVRWMIVFLPGNRQRLSMNWHNADAAWVLRKSPLEGEGISALIDNRRAESHAH